MGDRGTLQAGYTGGIFKDFRAGTKDIDPGDEQYIDSVIPPAGTILLQWIMGVIQGSAKQQTCTLLLLNNSTLDYSGMESGDNINYDITFERVGAYIKLKVKNNEADLISFRFKRLSV